MSSSPLPPLPSWTDPPAVTSYLVTVAGLVVGILQAFGVATPASEAQWVQVSASIAGLLVAGVAQAVNLITHRSAQVRVAALRVQATTAALPSTMPVAPASPPATARPPAATARSTGARREPR